MEKLFTANIGMNAGCKSWMNKVSLTLQWYLVSLAGRQNAKMVPLDVVTSCFNVISNSNFKGYTFENVCWLAYQTTS